MTNTTPTEAAADQTPLGRLLGDVRDQLHDQNPDAFHGDNAGRDCPRCNPATPKDTP